MDKIKKITIKKSKRKSVTLQCLEDGKLIVRAPIGMSKREIMGIVEEKSAWIERTRQQLEKRRLQEEALTLADSSYFPFLGRDLEVRRTRSKDPVVTVDSEKGHLEIAALDEESAKTALLSFIRQKAKSYLDERTEKWAQKMDLTYNTLRIKDQKTRWGSCSGRRNLNLNARIMLAPPQVIDYLIVHELAHLVHMNHSRAFYGLVASYVPDYLEHQGWLKNHGYLLSWGRN